MNSLFLVFVLLLSLSIHCHEKYTEFVVPPLCRQVDALQKFALENSDYAQESIELLRKKNAELEEQIKENEHVLQSANQNIDTLQNSIDAIALVIKGTTNRQEKINKYQQERLSLLAQEQSSLTNQLCQVQNAQVALKKELRDESSSVNWKVAGASLATAAVFSVPVYLMYLKMHSLNKKVSELTPTTASLKEKVDGINSDLTGVHRLLYRASENKEQKVIAPVTSDASKLILASPAPTNSDEQKGLMTNVALLLDWKKSVDPVLNSLVKAQELVQPVIDRFAPYAPQQTQYEREHNGQTPSPGPRKFNPPQDHQLIRIDHKSN